MSDNIHEIMREVQQTLKAPKNQYNSFGKYKYRSCEDIVEAVKAILPEGAYLNLSDDITECGGQVFVKATATFTVGSQSVSSQGYARHAQTKKGMDDSQITGSTSSYARKYALNGLFCIDDTKDADTDEQRHQQNNSTSQKEQSNENAAKVKAMMAGYRNAQTPEELTKLVRNNTTFTKDLPKVTRDWIETELGKIQASLSQAPLEAAE